MLQRSQAFRCAIRIRRQTEIKRHHRRFIAAHRRQRRFTVAGDHYLQVIETPFKLFLQSQIVFDQEQEIFGLLVFFVRHLALLA